MSDSKMYNVPLSSDSETEPPAPAEVQNMNDNLITKMISTLDGDANPDEEEEKQKLAKQLLELQNTLEGAHIIGHRHLSSRVDSVKEENLKLRSENQVLGQYIENLMSASSVFQPLSPKTKKKTPSRRKERKN